MIHESVARFGITDYVVFILILLMTIVLGIYFSFRQGKSNSLLEYFVGSRQMGILPVTMSLLATYKSPTTIIGGATEIYMYGAAIWYRNIAILASIPIVAYCYLPVFYNIKLTSVFEYLEIRFNSTLRKIGSFVVVVQLTIITSYMLYSSSLVLTQVTGLHFWIAVILTDIIATFYTTLGGIRAVMWTDVLQVSIIFVSIVTCTVLAAVDVGGPRHVFEEAWVDGLFNVSTEFDLRIRYTIWSISFPSMLNSLTRCGVGQMYVQRFVSAPTLKKARRSLYVFTITDLCLSVWLLLAGITIYAKYRDCDPLLTKKITKADQIIVLFIMETLHYYPGLCGLFVGGLFCAALSTVSSSLNSISAMILEDFIKKCSKFRSMSSSKATMISKVTTAVFGVLSLLFVPALDNLGTIFRTHMYNSNIFSGVNLGLFSLGLFVPWANSFGATIGALVGFAFSQWISVGSQMHESYTKRVLGSVTGCGINETHTLNFTNTFLSPSNETQSDIFPLYQITFLWIIVLSAVPVVVFGMIFSAIYRPRTTADLDINLISPVIRRFLGKSNVNQEQRSSISFKDQQNLLENLKSTEQPM